MDSLWGNRRLTRPIRPDPFPHNVAHTITTLATLGAGISVLLVTRSDDGYVGTEWRICCFDAL